jgi:hypothetical protein
MQLPVALWHQILLHLARTGDFVALARAARVSRTLRDACALYSRGGKHTDTSRDLDGAGARPELGPPAPESLGVWDVCIGARFGLALSSSSRRVHDLLVAKATVEKATVERRSYLARKDVQLVVRHRRLHHNAMALRARQRSLLPTFQLTAALFGPSGSGKSRLAMFLADLPLLFDDHTLFEETYDRSVQADLLAGENGTNALVTIVDTPAALFLENSWDLRRGEWPRSLSPALDLAVVCIAVGDHSGLRDAEEFWCPLLSVLTCAPVIRVLTRLELVLEGEIPMSEAEDFREWVLKSEDLQDDLLLRRCREDWEELEKAGVASLLEEEPSDADPVLQRILRAGRLPPRPVL